MHDRQSARIALPRSSISALHGLEERGIPLRELADHGAGWQAHVDDLTAHIHGRAAGDWRTRWAALTPIYRGLANRME
jgi:hypothetical protein